MDAPGEPSSGVRRRVGPAPPMAPRLPAPSLSGAVPGRQDVLDVVHHGNGTRVDPLVAGELQGHNVAHQRQVQELGEIALARGTQPRSRRP